MTGRWGGGAPELYVRARLTVDPGQQARGGHWLRYPTADYRCCCGHHEEASGDAVTEFVRDAARQHEPECPGRKYPVATCPVTTRYEDPQRGDRGGPSAQHEATCPNRGEVAQ